MLFNSYPFVFVFLPIVFVVYRVLKEHSRNTQLAWLTLSSLFFYGWWNPPFVGMLAGSILFNYWTADRLGKLQPGRLRKYVMLGAVACNLSLIGYFKYVNFFLDCINPIFQTDWNIENVFLPIGISFFTFQQIAYLVDQYQEPQNKQCSLMHYTLFVSFFPQLIAGPIVHHKQVLEQFAQDAVEQLPDQHTLLEGLSQFSFGLFKKVLIADQLATYAIPMFNLAENNTSLCMLDAWVGALAFSLQLYFDFSGYSDMAIGLGLMFGIRLPVNFNSPYKAQNISDFWRRWHITLSTFLRDYIYIPLGGNRKGTHRRYINLMITMLLGGLWHGAGITFIIWGGLHGLYLCIHHGWAKLTNPTHPKPNIIIRVLGVCITFTAVVFAWVLFRASNLNTAWNVIQGMIGLNGFNVDRRTLNIYAAAGTLFAALIITWFLPNTQQIHQSADKMFSLSDGEKLPKFGWHPTWPWALMTGGAFAFSCLLLNRITEFLYWQF